MKTKISAAANIGSQPMRVSEGLQVQFPLASFVLGDRNALRISALAVAANVYRQL